MVDVRGDAISIIESPDSLRRKVEFLRKQAIRGFSQTKEITDDYEPLSEDAGSLLLFTSATDKTFTVSSGLTLGWWCGIAQLGAGRANFLPGVGATVNSRAASDRTLDQYSRVWLEVVNNADGQSASYLLSGDVG